MNSNKILAYASTSGFNKELLEKMWRLTSILRDFGNDALLRENLALRGGTAINLVMFENLPRLSEDIDVDFSLDVDREGMQQKRQEINKIIERLMFRQGYVLSPKSRHSYALDGLRFQYTSLSGGNRKIKIEINYMIRQHVLPLERLTVHFPLLDTPLEVLAVAPLETMAFKISALLRRAAARDHFDVYNFIKSGLYSTPEDRELLRKLVVFYQAIEYDDSKQPLLPNTIVALQTINNISGQDVQNKLLPMLKTGDAYNIEQAQQMVTDFLKDLLVLTDAEKKFVVNFARGEYKPELLFDQSESQRIASHPMALWKCRS